MPADAIRELAHAYAGATAAQLCWTLGITEHHNGVDNVLSLCNLALLTGQVGRFGAGLTPLRGQNNVQGGGDMGALPDKLPGFQDVDDDDARAQVRHASGTPPIPPTDGWHLTEMFEAMERDELRSLFVIGENPAQSEADVSRAVELLGGLDHLVVLDIYLTKTAELADVVLPGSASWCESDGTVTNSERRVQRVRKALDPPGDARDDIDILLDLAAGSATTGTTTTTRTSGTSCAGSRRMHAGMSWQRLDELGGIQWPCPRDDSLEPPFLHGRLWADDPAERGRPAPFSVVVHDPPVESLSEEFPLRLTTGRRLDSYNTGVQSGGYRSPNRVGETIDISPDDADSLGVADGEVVRVVLAAWRRRGSGAHRPRTARRPRVHDVPLPRRGRRQPADDRRHRPEVRHRRVQGGRGSHRQDRGAMSSKQRASTMDLKTRGVAPSRPSAPSIESVLGPAIDGVGTTVSAAHSLRARRHLLLPTLHAVNDRVGWISQAAIDHIAERLDVVAGRGLRRRHVLRPVLDAGAPGRIRCTSASTWCAGPTGVRPRTDLPEGAHPSPCLGMCEQAPAALVIEAGEPVATACRLGDAGRSSQLG